MPGACRQHAHILKITPSGQLTEWAGLMQNLIYSREGVNISNMTYQKHMVEVTFSHKTLSETCILEGVPCWHHVFLIGNS